MKKMISVFVVLVLLVCTSYADTIDVSVLSDQELNQLFKNASIEIARRTAARTEPLFSVRFNDWEIIVHNDMVIEGRANRRYVKIHYTFINYGSRAIAMNDAALIEAYQNGIAISINRQIVDWNKTTFINPIKDGGSIDFYIGIYLNDFSAPFEFLVYKGGEGSRWGSEPLGDIYLTAPQ